MRSGRRKIGCGVWLVVVWRCKWAERGRGVLGTWKVSTLSGQRPQMRGQLEHPCYDGVGVWGGGLVMGVRYGGRVLVVTRKSLRHYFINNAAVLSSF